MADELYSARIRLPAAWKKAAEANGLNLSELTREALQREFKRRKIDVPDAPDVRRGAPKKTDDSK